MRIVDDVFAIAEGDQAAAGSVTMRSLPLHFAQERWDLIVQVPEFNGPSVRFVRAPDAEEQFNNLMSAAADLPGDMESRDLPEDEASRSALTEALTDVQLGLIAEQ